MTKEELDFLADVERRAKSPEMLTSIVLSAIRGAQNESENIREHASDIEVVAAMALNAEVKDNENFIADKLEKWKSISCVRWDACIGRLRKRG